MDKDKLSRKIKSKMVAKGITAAAIGKKRNWHRSTVSHTIAGTHRAKEVRTAIAEALGWDPWPDHEKKP